ncbi:sensor histidine kinase [Natronohydrobacter thiooxidans]|uniref:sensor histidine kinase n=1 Tax=Natronohydrobacter thiooxidans TaxID=87172 RepID=UPI0008FF1371|nr:ATP-binding protein [Natronohydrobacter thiooxidans]
MRQPGKALIWAGVAFGLALLALLTWLAHQQALSRSFQDLNDRGENTLNLAESTIRGQLERFERLPELLADQRVIRSLLLAPRDPDLIMAANTYLRDAAELLGASDLYVMYRDGVTLAASNFNEPLSFVGGNFAFRPYFFDAMAEGRGRFYALGTTSNKRGYYFGAAIDVAGQRLGVMVLKVDVDDLERAWASEDLRIIVTDPEDIIFLSNRPDWLFHAFGALTPDRLARTQQTQRYANAALGEIDFQMHSDRAGFRLLSGHGSDAVASEYLVVKSHMPQADWTVQVLLPTRRARAQAAASVAIGLLATGLLSLMALIIWQRRRQMALRLEMEQAAKDDLERQVTLRTGQLRAANVALEEEVTERRATEAQLRKTQSELVQAGKLAALGQMSAALSHEFNQPLGAARNYAENAQLLLEQDRREEAQGNIARILGMIDRLTRISRHLRNFARKPNQQLRAVALAESISEAQELLGWRLRKSGVTLEVDLGAVPLQVVAGPVRLQQVLVNLISNAIDAVEGAQDKRLHLRAQAAGERVQVTLRDHGPGVAEGLQARIFDPFFSTKEVGKGLGLGLSISYNIMRDFGGALAVENHPEGGAVFTLDLQAAASGHAEAAE